MDQTLTLLSLRLTSKTRLPSHDIAGMGRSPLGNSHYPQRPRVGVVKEIEIVERLAQDPVARRLADELAAGPHVPDGIAGLCAEPV